MSLVPVPPTRFRRVQAHSALVFSLAKPDKKSLHPDVLSDNSSAPLHNYLDEFLSAIRIFGFLEKPVSRKPLSVLES